MESKGINFVDDSKEDYEETKVVSIGKKEEVFSVNSHKINDENHIENTLMKL
jgi:hypothetical protein